MTPPTILTFLHFWMNVPMKNDLELDRFPVRKSPRLKNYDYSSANYYFVTICTKDKRCLFGSPTKLSAFGMIADDCLTAIGEHFHGVMLDKWVVMPNHIHAVIRFYECTTSLSTIVGQYKSAVTKRLRKIDPNIIVWQSSYHDHVIRNQADYERIWSYIDANPTRWMDDCFYSPE